MLTRGHHRPVQAFRLHDQACKLEGGQRRRHVVLRQQQHRRRQRPDGRGSGPGGGFRKELDPDAERVAGLPLEEATRRAVVAGALATTRVGAREGMPTATELETALTG